MQLFRWCAESRPAFLLLLLLTLTVASGCAGRSMQQEPVVVKRTQMHMGTLVSITAVAADKQAAQTAIEAGFYEIKRLEQLLSTWIPGSELSGVNQAAGKHAVGVSGETLELVQRSLDMARLTEGGFNIAVGPAVEAWSVTERQHIPTQTELQQLRSVVDWKSIQIDPEARTIFLPRQGMRIDVGGIGKGYAADRAVDVLRKAGATGGVVALSGDIKTFGDLPGMKGFPVGIRHPRQDGVVVATIDLQDEAISTAGDYERYFEQDGIRYHHILDPVSLEPARLCQSVTVIAREGTVADGLDTGIFVLGPERGMELVERLPDVEAVIIDVQGRMMVSSGLRDRLRYP
ncbi:FAD:protein FMN transferase [Nitrospira sp. NS4]|uniref:FAD:protein FMN transferase n=1 Tax=Nitrospira sp. NS4 TaxID=3414498 RepID=UPI003C2ED96F